MKRLSLLLLAVSLCLPVLSAMAWGEQNYIKEENLPPETLYALESRTYVQGIEELPYLYVLTEDEAGFRYLTVILKEDGRYRETAVSAPLPEINGIKPTIIANCILYSEALLYIFKPNDSGVWRLAAVQGEHYYRCTRYWLMEQDVEQGRLLYAADTNVELSRFDPYNYPPDFDSAAEALDTDGYAMVNNPNPEDRLHLRAEPSQNAESKGKYYSGTPVKIEADLGDWVKVSVTGVEGYMMKKYLAIGADMLSVQPAFPDLFIKEALYGQDLNVYTLADSQSEIAGILTDNGAGRVEITVIGLVGEDWVHVICGNGLTGYMPASDFFPGNG